MVCGDGMGPYFMGMAETRQRPSPCVALAVRASGMPHNTQAPVPPVCLHCVICVPREARVSLASGSGPRHRPSHHAGQSWRLETFPQAVLTQTPNKV